MEKETYNKLVVDLFNTIPAFDGQKLVDLNAEGAAEELVGIMSQYVGNAKAVETLNFAYQTSHEFAVIIDGLGIEFMTKEELTAKVAAKALTSILG